MIITIHYFYRFGGGEKREKGLIEIGESDGNFGKFLHLYRTNVQFY